MVDLSVLLIFQPSTLLEKFMETKLTSSNTNHASPKFIGVIGERNSGKSTIIRSLTGCSSSRFRGTVTAEDSLGNKRCVEVVCSSPQELSLNNPNVLTTRAIEISNFESLLAKAQGFSFNGLVSAIQPKSSLRKRITMEIMFNLALHHKFNCFAYILSPGYNQNSVLNDAEIIARLVSVGVLQKNIKTLNAEQFAILNAEIIRNQTRII